MTDVLGFELGLVYSASMTLTDAREEITRLSKQHDDPRNDVLLIATNSTTRGGLYFPSAKLIADLVFEAPKSDDLLGGWTPTGTRCIVAHDPDGGGRHRVLYGSLPSSW